jgi:hypothetical protein
MVTSSQIQSYVKAEPFRPFQLNMASGKTFDIRHPEMIKVAKTYLLVFTYDRNNPELIEQWETVSLMLIESVSHLESPVGA